MADMIRVNTALLEKCANELRAAAHGFGDAASILAGLDTGKEWWSKMGRINPLNLQDEGGSVELGDAGAAVRALTATMRRYDSRATTLGNNVSKAASMFDTLEGQLTSRANGQDAGEEGNIIGAAAVAGAVAGASVLSGETVDADARREREERAKWVKMGVGALCFVGSVAVVIATGGAALPVIAAGVAAGAVTAGVNNAADQYAEKGWDDIDWSDAGKDAVIGGIVGGVTSSISIAGGAVAQEAASRVAGQYVSSAAGRITTHVVGGVTSSVVSGAASRGTGEAVSQYLHDGDVDWNRVKERAFDPTQMAVDGVMGGATGYMRGRRYAGNGQYIRKESYMNANGDVDWSQAPNGGSVKGTEVTDYEIPQGIKLRRSGSEYGGYLRDSSDSFRSASLPYEYNPAVEHCYEVAKPIPGVTKSTAAPAFDMPGGATQYQLPNGMNVKELIDQGYLRKIY